MKTTQRLMGLGTIALLVALAAWLLVRDLWQSEKPLIEVSQPPEQKPQQLPQEDETASDELPSQPAPYIRYWRAEVDPDAVIVPARIGGPQERPSWGRDRQRRCPRRPGDLHVPGPAVV